MSTENSLEILQKSSASDVFYWFCELCRIPHASHNCAAAADFVERFAEERNLRHRRDSADNVIIWKEASAGREEEPTVMLQGHLDMVAVKKEDCDIDFQKDPLRLKIEGDLLFAEGTSLGGDDGIAVAMAMAVLDDDSISHPALECVFTTDEEIGMLGAAVLDTSDLRASYLLNMDSEDEGIFIASCAGGARVYIQVPLQEKKAGQMASYRIDLSGLTGGHSGVEINKGRLSANRLMLQLMKEIWDEDAMVLYKLKGGAADNVISSSAFIEVGIAEPEKEQLEQRIRKAAGTILKEAENCEKNIQIEWKEIDAAEKGYVLPCILLEKSLEIPQGVIAMSRDMEGLVETSANTGVIELEAGVLSLEMSIRSSIDEEKENLKKKIENIMNGINCEIEISGDYPGWPYRKDSRLQKIIAETYQEMFGKPAVIEAIHAGLECGILSRKMPEMDIIAFGPDMYDIHSVRERLSISSTERSYAFVKEMLNRLK